MPQLIYTIDILTSSYIKQALLTLVKNKTYAKYLKNNKAIDLQSFASNTEVAINVNGPYIVKKPGHSPIGFTVMASATKRYYLIQNTSYALFTCLAVCDLCWKKVLPEAPVLLCTVYIMFETLQSVHPLGWQGLRRNTSSHSLTHYSTTNSPHLKTK